MSEENTHSLLEQMNEALVLVELAAKELNAQIVKGNKAAGVRARKALRAAKQELHAITQASNALTKESGAVNG